MTNSWAVGSQNLLPDRQKVSTYISAFYEYNIFTFTLAKLQQSSAHILEVKF
jgi:hypothetical protein